MEHSAYAIKSISIEGRISGQVAQIQVSQVFTNSGNRTEEVSFVFPLPYDGAIDRMTLMVDGRELEATLYTAEEARRKYESIVRRNQDPALLEWIGSGMYQSRVFPLPAGARREVTLRYTQVCRADAGLVDFLFPLRTARYSAQSVGEVRFRLSLEAATRIGSVYSPTHDVSVERSDDRRALVTAHMSDEVPCDDFRLFFDVPDSALGASLISYRPDPGEDGYFLLLATPTAAAAADHEENKTVVLVLDRSGSMSGEKIEQARGAARFVVENLHDGDRLNIVAYDSRVEVYRPAPVAYGEAARREALGFLDGLYAGGSTNIDAALQTALGQLSDSRQPTYLILLSDGLPTEGEKNEMKIVEHVRQSNRVSARVMAFGVGYDVGSRMLDRIVRAARGQSEYVRPSEDIEAAVSRLYRRIASPVLTDVEIAFVTRSAAAASEPRSPISPPLDGVRLSDQVEAAPGVNRLMPHPPLDLFAGTSLVLVGRYRRAGAAEAILTGSQAGQRKQFRWDVAFDDSRNDQTHAFVEKLWATRRVGDIIDELDLKGKNDELIEELLGLARRHGILTPYTSFLADETADVGGRTEQLQQRASARAERYLERLSGASAFAQRSAKSRYLAADRPIAAVNGRHGVGFYYSAEEDRKIEIATVRTVGTKTFFRRQGSWVEAGLTQQQQREARRIERFSDEYFRLAARYGKAIAPYLAFDEPLIVEIDGQAYAW
jgi:Ca-activated chloride channel family protein